MHLATKFARCLKQTRHANVKQRFLPRTFQAIDKRNQNIISSILGDSPPENCSHAEMKARTFYQSCIAERETVVSEDLVNLQVCIEMLN